MCHHRHPIGGTQCLALQQHRTCRGSTIPSREGPRLGHGWIAWIVLCHKIRQTDNRTNRRNCTDCTLTDSRHKMRNLRFIALTPDLCTSKPQCFIYKLGAPSGFPRIPIYIFTLSRYAPFRLSELMSLRIPSEFSTAPYSVISIILRPTLWHARGIVFHTSNP
jgi:hypothetical protein